MKFRITTWPDSKVPLPDHVDLAEIKDFEIDNGNLVFDFSLFESAVDPPPFHEVYLQLLQLDLDSEQAICQFVNDFAPLRAHDPTTQHYKGLTGSSGFWDHVQPRLEAAEARGLDRTGDQWTSTDTVESFRWGAVCIMDLVTAWRFVRWGTPPTWRAPIWKYPDTWHEDERTVGPPRSRAEAAEVLTSGLRSGLERFGPNVIVHEEIEAKGPASSAGSPDLYSYCCLELFNHVVEDAPYKRCRNEECDRLFVRQQGRAEYGQHRVRGVKYCSVRCMNAQSQRRFRRKAKQRASG